MFRSRLPLDLTSFVGRTSELDQLADVLTRSRLVTLTGGPGIGKTRLALQLVRDRIGPERDVAWTELAALREPGLLIPVLAQALEARDEVRPGDVETLARLIGERQTLLVLDNCEHLVDVVAGVVDGLLRACPGLSVLVTSREALGVRGERAWLVPPLGVPDADRGSEAPMSEAVGLFVERAREVVPDFALTPSTAPAVEEICRRLDGIPLAIELAAARVRILQPRDLLARLDDVFGVLKDDRRTSVPRHRTLRAAIDWSYDLLDEPSRTLLHRLAVFRGGLTLGAAESVGPGGTIAVADVLELVGRLVDRSMLVVRERAGFARYHLLEAVRKYASEKLAASGEEHEVRRRHAHYLLALVEEAGPHLIDRDRRAWVDRLRTEIDNLRSALEWTRSADPALHVRLVGGLWWFWFSTQHWAEGARWIEGALGLEAAAEPGMDRARLLFASGALATLQVRTAEGRPPLEEAAKLAAAHGDGRLEAYAFNYLGLGHAGEGRKEAAALCRRAEAWFRAHDDLYGLRLSLILQGSSALAGGDLGEAERLNREGVDVARRFGQARELAISLQNLAVVLIVQGRLDEAEALITEALAASRGDQSYYFIATGVMYLGEIAGRRGEPLRAARLLGAAEGLREVVAARPFPIDRDRIEALLPGLRSQAGPAAFEEARASGRSMSLEAIFEELAGRPEEGSGASFRPSAGAGARRRPAAVPEGPRPDAESSALVVAALGRFRVVVDGTLVTDERWPYAKPRELLVHLLLHPGGRTRDQIGEALWPDAPRSNVKNSFHVTLHHLRKALGHPEWIGIEGERYRLTPGLEPVFDAATFEAEARRALESRVPSELRATIARYHGELLEGHTVGRWIDEHRERLRRLYVELHLALGDALDDSDPVAAAETYRALAASEELDEEVHRRLMSALVRSGDRAGAIRHYERLETLLERTLDAAPDPETRALYDRIRAG